MSGSDCTSVDGCGPALTTIEKGNAHEIKCENGPNSQCASLCPDDSSDDIANALKYTNNCATEDDSLCDKPDSYNPRRSC